MSEIEPDLSGYYDGLLDASRPYRWATWLNDAVVEYCSMSDYTLSTQERDDIATDIINQTIERNGVDAAQGYEYLHHWRSIYGRDLRGE